MADFQHYDLVMIGGGPAGYVGAIRAAQLGLNVACVELDKLGGTCLNWGCIPTKALLAAAEFYDKLNNQVGQWGIVADEVRHDWSKLIARSRGVAGNLNKGIAALFKKNRITHIEGRARIAAAGPPGTIEISGEAGTVTGTIEADHIVIAAGARPRALPGVAFDGQRVISSKEAMTLPQQPRKLLIVGAGAIGMEFAYFYNAFGTEVVVIEMLDHLLPVEDEEVSAAIEKAWRKQKIEYHVATKTLAADSTASGIELIVAPVSDEAQRQIIAGDKVLIAVGVQGNHEGLFDNSLGVEIENEHIKVDRANYRTAAPGIYAVGDVIGPPWLAHVASEEAVICVETIAGRSPHAIDYNAIPACTFCHPQVASLGLTEQACDEQDLDYKVGKFPFQASGKAQAVGATQGFVKIICDQSSGEILGVHMIGENVTELLAEMGLAKRLEATAAEVVATMHAHPTLSEAIHEASLGLEGGMIHF